MVLEDLKKNIENEKRIINDLNSIYIHLNAGEDKSLYLESIVSLLEQLKMLNKPVPELLKRVSSGISSKNIEENKVVSRKEQRNEKKKLSKFSYVSPSSREKRYVSVDRKDRGDFLKKLSVSEKGLEGLRKKRKVKGEVSKPSFFASLSNRIFRKISERITPKFDGLSDDLKKANIRFLTSTYISMALFFGLVGLILGLVSMGILMFFTGSLWVFLAPVALPVLILVGFYFYPALEKGAVEKNISYELPFATIQMAAIAGSDVEPTKIFKIIATSEEYPHVGLEMRKVVNQVDVYGYDLVTALKNVSNNTSNKLLVDLFNGLATNISSGGDLKTYLDKKAENYLNDYRLERERYSDLAGTFMDIYISILIAAPLVLMMMFIIMSVSGLSIGFGLQGLMIISVSVVVLANIIFLVFLQLKQPNV